ncbi:hypothetical protein MMC28_008564 [Mycoblastus sanguinarius]|nr:hypothetical protein [Mycoblastus sanguinarius]
MKLPAIIALAAWAFPLHALSDHSSGCAHSSSNPIPGGPSIPFTVNVPTAGGSRRFLLHLPSTYSPNEPHPLILAFHGKGQDGAQFEDQTQLTNSSFNTLGAVVAFPEGIKNQWLGDPTSPPQNEVDDIAFATDLLADITENHCISLDRVFIVGFSNGGGLTHLLSCDPDFSRHVAAAAIVSGAFYKDHSLKGNQPLFGRCAPARSPLPVLEMHGSQDPVIHYDGKTTPDGDTYPIEEWLVDWRKRNGCDDGENEEVEQVHGDGAQKRVWSCGNEQDRVLVHYFVKGFGHGWPSRQKQDDDEQRFGPLAWDGTRDIIDFFTLPAEAMDSDTKDEL